MLFLCVATNDNACDTSYLVTACSGLPGTRLRYRIGFSVAAPTANGSLISMSLPTPQMWKTRAAAFFPHSFDIVSLTQIFTSLMACRAAVVKPLQPVAPEAKVDSESHHRDPIAALRCVPSGLRYCFSTRRAGLWPEGHDCGLPGWHAGRHQLFPHMRRSEALTAGGGTDV